MSESPRARTRAHTYTQWSANNVLTPASLSAVCSPPSVYATLHRLKAARGISLIITCAEILHFIGDKCCEQIYKGDSSGEWWERPNTLFKGPTEASRFSFACNKWNQNDIELFSERKHTKTIYFNTFIPNFFI